jgi:outer membrane receptor protein involved in Fe transport
MTLARLVAYRPTRGGCQGAGREPPTYLPGHTTLDLSLGKDFGERYSLSVNALNLANRHLLIDNSPTFGGTHWLKF